MLDCLRSARTVNLVYVDDQQISVCLLYISYRNIVRLLLLRGETSVRILDARPPPNDILSNPAIEFVEMNMASLTSTQAALAKVFEKTGKAAEVVYHVAATIRFWVCCHAWLPQCFSSSDQVIGWC